MTDNNLTKLAADIRAHIGLPDMAGRSDAPSRKEVVVATLRLLAMIVDEADGDPDVEVARAVAAAGASQLGEPALVSVVSHLLAADSTAVYGGLGVSP